MFSRELRPPHLRRTKPPNLRIAPVVPVAAAAPGPEAWALPWHKDLSSRPWSEMEWSSCDESDTEDFTRGPAGHPPRSPSTIEPPPRSLRKNCSASL